MFVGRVLGSPAALWLGFLVAWPAVIGVSVGGVAPPPPHKLIPWRRSRRSVGSLCLGVEVLPTSS